MDAVARTFKPLWRANNGFTVSSEGSHRVLFVFDNKDGVDRILSSERWSFDKSLVVLQRYDRLTPLDETRHLSGFRSIIFQSDTGISQSQRTYVNLSV